MTIRIGTAAWALPRGVRERFPEQGSNLERYAALLTCAEINTSFYRPHRPATYERWAASVPQDFRFSLKLPKAMSHVAALAECEAPLAQFADETAALGHKRGPVLVQLPPKQAFDAAVAEIFFAQAGALLPSIVLEPRHASWFEPEADALLVHHRIARVAADPAPVPAAALPGGWRGLAYFRLHGSPKAYWSSYDEAALAEWAAKAEDANAAETWVIFDNTGSGAATGDALAFQAIAQASPACPPRACRYGRGERGEPMRHVAIIGSGPAGYYTAEACQKQFGLDGVRVDIIDRLPVPFGLIRTGVAPDHQSIKGVSRRYNAVSLTDNVRFVGNVMVGTDVSIEELLGLYDAVVLATGAPRDRPLDVPGADLPGVVGSAAFVGWYNGHPDFADLAPRLARGAVVIGNGNVALDVARILAKTEAEFAGSDIVGHAFSALKDSEVETITLLGRRGPHQIAMTPKELGELGELARAAPIVDPADLPDPAEDAALDPGQRKSVAHLRAFAARPNEGKPIRIVFDFLAMPVAIEGADSVERVIVERTQLDAAGNAHGTGETYAIDAGLVVSCIGYRTPPIHGVPYDERAGRFANDEGRIQPGLYAVGWARRGPSGTIGTNRPDGYAIAEKIAADIGEGMGKAGREGLDALFAERGVDVVTFRDWQRIEAAEIAAARDGSPREKFISIEAMLGAAHPD